MLVLQADPEAVELIAQLVERLFERDPAARCERRPTPATLVPAQVAVGVSHNDQKDNVRAALDTSRLCDLIAEIANKLQGLEFEATFVWHPLSRLPKADEFHLDPGRMCVLLPWHRHA